MTCLKHTFAEANTGLSLLPRLHMATAKSLLDLEHTVAGALAIWGHDLFNAAVGAACAQGLSAPDAGDIEYASWMPDRGAIEFASWTNGLRAAAR